MTNHGLSLSRACGRGALTSVVALTLALLPGFTAASPSLDVSRGTQANSSIGIRTLAVGQRAASAIDESGFQPCDSGGYCKGKLFYGYCGSSRSPQVAVTTKGRVDIRQEMAASPFDKEWHFTLDTYRTATRVVSNQYSFFHVFYSGDRYAKPYFTCSQTP